MPNLSLCIFSSCVIFNADCKAWHLTCVQDGDSPFNSKDVSICYISKTWLTRYTQIHALAIFLRCVTVCAHGYVLGCF